MNTVIRTLVIVAGLVLIGSPVMAQDAAGGKALLEFSGALGVGLVVMGAAYSIGKLSSAAYESMARQPEVAGQLFTALIVAAALIEGFTFYAIFVCSSQNPWAK